MNIKFKYKASDIRRIYFDEKAHDEIFGEWGAFIFYRWLSFPVTAWFINAKISANSSTMASILLSIALCLVFFITPVLAYMYLSIIAIIISVLDCVDGNIARTTKTSSAKGHYLDFIADIIYRIFLYLSLGYVIQSTNENDLFLIRHAVFFCLLSAFLAIFSRLCRVYVEKWFEDSPFAGGNPEIREYKVKNILFSFVSGLDPLLPLFIFIAGINHVLHWLVFWLITYSVIDVIHTQYRILTKIE